MRNRTEEEVHFGHNFRGALNAFASSCAQLLAVAPEGVKNRFLDTIFEGLEMLLIFFQVHVRNCWRDGRGQFSRGFQRLRNTRRAISTHLQQLAQGPFQATRTHEQFSTSEQVHIHNSFIGAWAASLLKVFPLFCLVFTSVSMRN